MSFQPIISWLLIIVLMFTGLSFTAASNQVYQNSHDIKVQYSAVEITDAPIALSTALPRQEPTLTSDEGWTLLMEAYYSEDYEECMALANQVAYSHVEDIELLVNCSGFLWEMGDYDGAIYAMEDAIHQGGAAYEQLYFTLALILYDSGESAKADALIEDVMRLRPDDLEFVAFELEYLYRTQAVHFETRLASALNYYPEYGPLHLLRAYFLADTWQYEEAILAVKKAVAWNSEYGMPLYETYQQFLLEKQAGQYTQALRTVDRLIAASDEYDFWLERVMMKLWDMADPQTTLADLDALLKKYPEDDMLWFIQALALCQMEEYEQVETLIQTMGDGSRSALLKGILAIHKDSLELALESFDAYIALYPGDPVGYLYKIQCLNEMAGDTEAAYALLSEAMAFFPNEAEFYASMGDLHVATKQYTLAQGAYQTANEHSYDDASIYGRWIRMLIDWGRPEEALALLEMAEQQYPGWLHTLLIRYDYECSQLNFEAALAVFDTLEAKFPYFVQELATARGVLLCSLGDYEQGLALLEANLDATDPVYLNDYAYALTMAGETEQAAELLIQAFALLEEGEYAPGTRDQLTHYLLVTQAELACTQGDLDAALALLEQACQLGWTPTAAIYPLLAPIVKEKGFQALVLQYQPE